MDLIIIETLNDFSLLKNYINSQTDILVFDQKTMIALDLKGIKYKVIEDFYPKENYYTDVHNFRPKVTNLFKILDKVVTTKTNFPYSFSGNEHYFSTLFDDLLFLDTLIKVIKRKYSKFYFFSSIRPEINQDENYKYSQLNSRKINGSISFQCLRTQNNQLKILYNTINPVFIKDKISRIKYVPLNYRMLKIFYKLNARLYNFIIYKNYEKLRKKGSDEIRIYCIQDSYEVTPLKKYLPHYKYENPVTKLRQKIETLNPEEIKFSEIDSEIKNFAEHNFLNLANYCIKFLKSYSNEIVGRISSFKKEFQYLVKKDNPKLLLVGSGTRDVFDTICLFVFNELKINVISFQHTGTRILSDKAYDESLEFNQRVEKTLIVQSKRDLVRLKNSKTVPICFGSIQQYEKNIRQKDTKKSKNIFLCLGPDIDFSFRHLVENYSVSKKYIQSLDIISIADKLNIPLHIKLHPTGEEKSFFCYQKIINNKNFRKTKILYGRNVESISENYKIVITDYISSTAFRHLISLKVPIIIYDKDFDKMRISKEDLELLLKRCYVAKKKDDLERLLKDFLSLKLKSKWNTEIIDRLIYPIEKGNPGKNIANYIETIAQNI